jgi:DNA-binding XRE family transcriptional regulator
MAFPLAAVQLKTWRTEVAKLSQGGAAELFDVRQPTYSDWENGRKTPRTVLALKIAAMTEGAVPIESWGVEAPPSDPEPHRGAAE